MKVNRTIYITIMIAATLILTLAQPAYALQPTSDEAEMLALINQKRDANGLQPLELDPRLQLLARSYSQEMLDNDFFDHDSPISGSWYSRIRKSGIEPGWEIAGENLAGAPTVESAFDNLMASPEHRDNILEKSYTHIGVGIVDGGPYGKLITQQFVAYPDYKPFIALTDILQSAVLALSAWLAV